MNPQENPKGMFEALFYGSDTPMVIFKGADAVVEMFNDKYHEIYRRRDVLGKSLFDAVPELKNSQFPEILKRVFETGENYFSREVRVDILNPKTGELEERFFDTTFSRIQFDANGEYRILATPREVTDRVRYRQQLEHSLKELEDEREFREFFISALSHDLRTPLAILKLSAEVLSRREKKFEDVKALAEKMIDSVNNTDKMIRDLLDADRIRAGQWLTVLPESACIKTYITSFIENLNKIYPDRLVFISHGDNFEGEWDKLAIQRIFENLVSNAVKYGGADSKITITLNAESDSISLSIHNLGNPIPEKDLDLIFKKHKQSGATLKAGKLGWGIGLALVKALTEAHGGLISVTSSEENGTLFTIKIPKKFIDSEE